MSPTVLFTASTYSHLANFHRPYLAAFQALGWAVDAAAGGAPILLPEARRSIPLPFEKKMTAPSNLRAQRILREAMAQTGYDLVVCHTSLAAFFTRRAAAGLGGRRPPLVNVAHGYLFDEKTPAAKRGVLLAAEKLTAPQTDLLLTMNQWDLDMARRQKLARRIQSIPGMGVDFSRLDGREADGAALRRELGLAPGAVLAVYAAEFSRRKSQSVLIRALAQSPENLVLALPGQGELWESCRALARSLGVERRVIFPGQQSDMPRWYAAADAAVSASRSEGLPFNIMEAMYAGLPIVATRVKGHTDLLACGCGLFFDYGDPDSCAARFRVLAQDASARQSLGALGRRESRLYGLETVLPQVMQAYLSVVSPALRPAPERGAVG